MILERDIEAKVVRWARAKGIMVTKLQGIGNKSMPDRIFWIPGGRPVLIEFKRPGGKLTPLQTLAIEALEKAGYLVTVFDNADDAIAYLGWRL